MIKWEKKISLEKGEKNPEKYHKLCQILKTRNSWNYGSGSNQEIYY
jgi:hypothetical protein